MKAGAVEFSAIIVISRTFVKRLFNQNHIFCLEKKLAVLANYFSWKVLPKLGAFQKTPGAFIYHDFFTS